MSITVFEAMKLDTFKKFKLVAGHRGLENRISTVGILDYEFDAEKEEQFYKGQFLKEQFVISSLLFAKNNPDRIVTALRYLALDGVSGLAIKDIYYDNLPQEALDFANDNLIPIFIFDNSVFFEDIITEIMDRVRFEQNYELMESKIGFIIKNNVSRSVIKELSLEINNYFKDCSFVIYLKEKKYLSDDRIISVLNKLKFNRNIKNDTSILKYKGGILIISTYEHLDESKLKDTVYNLINLTGLNSYDHFIGVSNVHHSLEEIDKGINESIYAAEACEIAAETLYFYKDIGIYKILLPYAQETWLSNFYNEIISHLKRYDEKYHTEMFHTALKYIENDGVIKVTAEALFIHENTVRYRLNKIKEILDMKDQEGSFYEQLSAATKLYKIYENKH
jgi:hypothetical protein